MITPELKAEWIEKVKIINPTEIPFDNFRGFLKANTCLYQAPEEIKMDKDVLFSALINSQESFYFVPQSLRADRDFILSLLDNNYKDNVYYYLPLALKEDILIFEKCVARKEDFGFGMPFPKSILENKALILKTLEKYKIYKYCEEMYKHDEEVVSLNILKHGSLYEYKKLPKRMYNKLSKNKKFTIPFLESNPSAYKLFPEQTKSDLDIIHALLKKSRFSISEIPEELRNDKAFMSYAISTYNCPLDYSPLLSQNNDLIKLIVEQDGKELKKFPLVSDPLIGELALKTCNDIHILNPFLLKNKELVIQFLKANPVNCTILLKKTNDYLDDYDIVKLLTLYDGELLKTSPKWRDYSSLVQLSLNTSSDISLLNEELLKDKELVIQLLKSNVENIQKLSYITNLYKNDYDIVKINIDAKPSLISQSPLFKADKEMIEYAISKGLKSISDIDPSFLFDKELMSIFVRLDERNYEKLPLIFKNDYDIIKSFLDIKKSKNFSTDMIRSKIQTRYSTIISESTLNNNFDFNLWLVSSIPEVFEISNFNSQFIFDNKILHAYFSNQSSEKYYLPEKIILHYKTYDIHEIKEINAKNIEMTISREKLEIELEQKDIAKKLKL